MDRVSHRKAKIDNNGVCNHEDLATEKYLAVRKNWITLGDQDDHE
jgi:hypothetical protein